MQPHRMFQTVDTPDGTITRTTGRGQEILANPLINKGTAFTPEERRELGLEGLLPGSVVSLESQVKRVYEQYLEQPTPLAKNVYLTALRDRNEVLFYRILTEHIQEMMPVVYTPTIGEAIERFSHWFHRPRGVFLSIDNPGGIEQAFRNYGIDPEEVDLIVTTDAEGILGIGDQGVGGIQIAIGKLSVYTAAAGIHPRRVIPVMLDVGTDNLSLLSDEAYLGLRHTRVRGERYDAFIAEYIRVVSELFPNAMLHWEDFGASNAHRILEQYRDEFCTFNDDIQGTAAVVAAAALSAVRSKHERMSDQRVVIHGAGTAGVGIADLMVDMMVREGMPRAEARKRFFCLGSKGLITEALGDRVRPFQKPYAQSDATVAAYARDADGKIGLLETVRGAQPTILIGTSGQPGSFTESVVREMAATCPTPIIMPLSNPTALAEATPWQLLAWTKGAALVATGSPFDPVILGGREYQIAQANNALVFPGLGLGVIICRASRVSDGMITAAAEAVAEITKIHGAGDPLLPPVTQLRRVSAAVALAVVDAAVKEGLARVVPENPVQAVYEQMWQPVYPRVEAI